MEQFEIKVRCPGAAVHGEYKLTRERSGHIVDYRLVDTDIELETQHRLHYDGDVVNITIGDQYINLQWHELEALRILLRMYSMDQRRCNVSIDQQNLTNVLFEDAL